MKNLLHNISIMVVLALMMAGIQSCSDDWQEVGDVQVSFTAILPTDTRTRSFGKAEQVNTLVVGVFKRVLPMCILTVEAVGVITK